jgi:hypothetical protein
MKKLRPDAWHAGPRATSSMTVSCIATAPQVSCSGAFPLRKVKCYSSIFMRGFVGIMLRQGVWLERLSNKIFTGRRSPPTRLRSWDLVRCANTLWDRSTLQPKSSTPSPWHGRLPCNTSRTTIFSKTIHLQVRICVYADIRTIIVLTCDNANWFTFHIYFLKLTILEQYTYDQVRR